MSKSVLFSWWNAVVSESVSFLTYSVCLFRVSDLDLRMVKQVACTRVSGTFSLMFDVLAFFGFKGAMSLMELLFLDVILIH